MRNRTKTTKSKTRPSPIQDIIKRIEQNAFSKIEERSVPKEPLPVPKDWHGLLKDAIKEAANMYPRFKDEILGLVRECLDLGIKPASIALAFDVLHQLAFPPADPVSFLRSAINRIAADDIEVENTMAILKKSGEEFMKKVKEWQSEREAAGDRKVNLVELTERARRGESLA